jgi:uncharacterized membrane-anchored protein YhcB (DUF1043 family)
MTEPSFLIPQLTVVIGVVLALLYLERTKADVKTAKEIREELAKVKTEKADKDAIEHQLNRIEVSVGYLVKRIDAHIDKGGGEG